MIFFIDKQVSNRIALSGQKEVVGTLTPWGCGLIQDEGGVED